MSHEVNLVCDLALRYESLVVLVVSAFLSGFNLILLPVMEMKGSKRTARLGDEGRNI
ncbi:hypothetical protein GYMLUDRAFT_45193 [Collybiopsis luxurians FD-317 M1]|uniref:Uncharacterized protein n=1 Tax=Collybiopsis luxurians FD-317 M1 TaxID=944289 RepID=A0A0D0CSE5_9AGAR|nr:hypothetical protein GYMLUDRAFT_45193 [Collybiopsis luxurians FD-317 M1]